ncbi:type IV secretory system conjugative DNA transfer family protein [Pyrobaculum sp. 3827-6]|uniref:type IV secretory system conjugative DNA transfer family protein n=1 Tax=Pyrobaculum sp. 3827-6 TaxID=2983604 RepID=UPI0021D926CD|nr:type IV secretory system conjugative DNA transfer family protein [Pyrobaculum sp. 3827-6]MCU7788207.1 type IV secretory system conjugative DNA transfer family protein [Pyrobaculum sp. 3827-6]
MTLYTQLFRLVTAVEGNALITGLPGTGKTSFVKWSLREVPSDYAVVVYDTAGDFKNCNYAARYSVNPLDLPTPRVVEILEEALAATYGEYPYLLTPAMAELLHRTVEKGAHTLSQVRREVLNAAEPHEMDTAYALRRRLVHFDGPQFEKTDVPIRHGASTCVDVSGLDRVGRLAYVLAHLELTRDVKNVIYVVDEAHRFLAFTSRYSLLTDHLRTGRSRGRFFILVSHSYREFQRHLGYVKMVIRFPDWDLDESKTTPLQPSEALITVRAASLRSAEALAKLLPLRGTWAQFRITVPPYAERPTA